MNRSTSSVDSGTYNSDSEESRAEDTKFSLKPSYESGHEKNGNKDFAEKLKELKKMAAEEARECDRQEKSYLLALEWLNNINNKFCHYEMMDLYVRNYYCMMKGFDNLYSPRLEWANLKPKFKVGKRGAKAQEFFHPWGIHADFMGRILVADRMNHRIQIFSESGKFLRAFGEEGSGPGQFCRPSAVVVDKNWRIIVADKDNHRIQIFTFSGAFWSSFGKLGSDPGEFTYPWDVAVNDSCQIAVSDGKNHRVQLFDFTGRFLNLIDFKKDIPRGLDFLPDGSLAVAGFESHLVKIFNKELQLICCVGQRGSEKGEIFRPQGLTCDQFGRIAVSDSKNYRIQIFNSRGQLLRRFGGRGDAAGEFDCPQGISFHPNGNLLVVDLNNSRFQAF